MAESVILAVVTGILAVIGSYVGNVAITHKKNQEDTIRDAEREARQQVRLENIERKLDIHNGYAEKIGDIRQDLTKIQKDIEYLRKENK